jgi:hypothetical protein
MLNNLNHKYLKYKLKYKLNQKGGNYLLTLTETDECCICLEKLIDTCASCKLNGNNYCPIPRHDYKNDETDPRFCGIHIGECGHAMHNHCISKINDGKCPIDRKIFDAMITCLPQYVWSSGYISPRFGEGKKVEIRENENGGKWKQIQLLTLIDMIKNRRSIAPYIYNNITRSYQFSSPENYSGFIKTYEDSIL